jgi:superfamily II DNA/RNA helicase
MSCVVRTSVFLPVMRRLLQLFTELAKSILKNSKGERLLTAKTKGGAEKAIIFTESTRTQEYVRSILESTFHYKSKVVLFNGSNNDPKAKEIYQNWLKKHEGTYRITGSRTADLRAALVDYFRDEAIIMVATEAAAEGSNLQFCCLVINYDLPWNPQRSQGGSFVAWRIRTMPTFRNRAETDWKARGRLWEAA